MSLNNPVIGEGYVPAYQMSASPYVTSSFILNGQIHEVQFGCVTKFFTVMSTGTTSEGIAVAFTRLGLTPQNSNFFKLSGSNSYTAEIRTDRLFISGSSGTSSTYTVIAGLTPIPESKFLMITGSNGFIGVG
jgi:hypothetical protein